MGPAAHHDDLKIAALHALIVDDNPSMRTVLRKMLETFGVASIREAASAEEAEIALGEQRADVIFLDHTMPEKLGLDFLREMRAAEANGGPWLVMMSGFSDALFQDAAHAAGADAFLAKPVRPEDLLNALVPV